MYIRGTENHYRPISIGLIPRSLPMPDTKLRHIVLLRQSSSCAQLFATSWTAACQAPPSMGFSRQYWSGLPFPSPGDVPNPEIQPRFPALQADSLPAEPPGKPFAQYWYILIIQGLMSLFIAGKLSTVRFFFFNVTSPSVSLILLTELFDGS